MATSDTDIANLALSHLNNSKEIGNLTTENSAEANAVRRFYETARKKTLRDFAWPFATRFERLALVQRCPTPEWRFSYRIPSGCIQTRRILHPRSGRQDNAFTRARFRIVGDDIGELLYIDWDCAELEYTTDITNTAQFAADFVMAFSYKLAELSAPRVTGGDPFKLGDKAQANYFQAISQASANAANEQQPDPAPESEFILARDEPGCSQIPGIGGTVFFPSGFIVE